MVSDIAEIEAHRDRAQADYDKLPLSGPVTSWCELYGEDLLDSCTKLLVALKQRTELIDAAAGHWLESCRVTSPPIPWEGAIDGAMEAACKEIERLRARVAELEAAQEWRPIETLKESIGEYVLLSVHMMGNRMPELGYRDPLGVVRSNRMAVCSYATHWLPLPAPPKAVTP